MNFAAWCFPVSMRHDVVIPALVVVGLWIAAGWYYHMNTFPGGVIVTPDQAVAVIRQKCGEHNNPEWTKGRMTTKLQDGTWYAYRKLINYRTLHSYGAFLGTVDAQTGQVRNCVYQSYEF